MRRAQAQASFSLQAEGITDGGTLPDAQVFNGMGCTGQNQSPALTWTQPPTGTKSLAVTAFDPDAPTGSGWWHWVVFNLPADTRSLPAGAGDPSSKALPAGAVQSRSDYGTPGFGGACPPEGDKPHRYIFTVWALKLDKLPLDADASGAMVGYYLNQNALGKATLTATYGR